MSKKVKVGIVLLVVAILAVAGIIFAKKFMKKTEKDNGKLVYVQSVKDITGVYVGLHNRYMGIVESQEVKKVNKDSDKKIKEIKVKEGDSVKEGDPLFSYDTDDMELELQKKEIELDEIGSNISELYNEIDETDKQRETVPDDMKYSYTSSINLAYQKIKSLEYDKQQKELEIEKQKESIKNSVVKSPMNGVVKKIDKSKADSNSNNEGMYMDEDMGGGTEDAFITIMANGEFHVKGTVSETNLASIVSGTPVIIRSRVDETMTWAGVIDKLDYEPNKSEGDDYYGMNSGEGSSKYSFYVKLETSEGLILGQHLYIEPDYGQSEKKDGLYLSSYYLVQDGSDFYVWARGKNKKIEKRKLNIGEYDENNDSYEILGGLTKEDYIAFPSDNIVEGSKTTTDMMEAMENGALDDMGGDGDMMPDGVATDGDAFYEEVPNDGVMPGRPAPGGMIPDDEIPDGGVLLPDGTIGNPDEPVDGTESSDDQSGEKSE
ncbi:efflux RND transporter periplasmic adaptor subunit [Eubacterium ruminantium]|uniref:efflux RND transporter periplasmic adaptor subunit n=1 Tax=Eubacterium ruminantium TaxID=42322 RepID=UPI001569AFAE|nr:efflux RND transporter periplasmic adaptor subunit [Eubacterium ruminantium]